MATTSSTTAEASRRAGDQQQGAQSGTDAALGYATPSPWAGLHSRFLSMRTAEEQTCIFDLSARAAQSLHRWAAQYPLIRRVRVWPLALSVAAAAPFSSIDALIATARLSLWVFTLDDLFDEERVPRKTLLQRAERYRAIVQGEPAITRGDSLAAALQDVRDDLARHSLFAALQPEWAAALCGTIDGMSREYDWRLEYRSHGAAALPSYEDYLANGLYSIGGPPHVWAAMITTADSSIPRHVESLRHMEKLTSTCIRLANDLQSHIKEIEEDKVNALVILGQSFLQAGYSPADAAQQAEARVRADMADGLRRLGQLQAEARTRTGQPEAAIADIARFVCDFYTAHDYHTFMPSQSLAGRRMLS